MGEAMLLGYLGGRLGTFPLFAASIAQKGDRK